MALETLKDVEEVGGFKVNEIIYENGYHVDTVKESCFINIDHGENTVTFEIQDGPIKENGINGCQVDTIIETAKLIVEGLNKKFPCRENAMVITKLDEALMWSKKRKEDREARGVEGQSKK